MISAPEAGTVLAGKYRVLRVLGEGGMGIVVAALHLELDQLVAVKFLHQAALGNPEALARFTREARAAARIKSEHVARVIDVSRLENGAPYMVMEYLEGEDLAARLRAGPLSIEDAVDYVVQACDAVAEAHAVGIVHRDLKPSNLFLTRRPNREGLVKVLDFGISKLLINEVGAAGLTNTAALMGSPLYMSPEQMRSARDVDARTDLWALGAILFELLTAHAPFPGESLPEVINAVMACQPLRLSQFRPDVPPELERTILRCLAKDRTERLQTVGELATELAQFVPRRSEHVVARVRSLSNPPSAAPRAAEGAGELAGVSAAPAAPALSAPHATSPAWSGTQAGAARKGRSKARGRWLVAGTVMLVGAGVAIALALGPSSNANNAAASGARPGAELSGERPIASAPINAVELRMAAGSGVTVSASTAAALPPAASVAIMPHATSNANALPRPVASAPIQAVRPAGGVAPKPSAPPSPSSDTTTVPAGGPRRRNLDIDLK